MIGIRQDDNEYLKWIKICKEALLCLDKKDYYWHHLPCAGGYYEQDTFIMNIWEVIADEYIMAIHDEDVLKELRKRKPEDIDDE